MKFLTTKASYSKLVSSVFYATLAYAFNHSQPLPFEVKFTPRFENTVALIEEARAEYPIGS